MIIFSLIYFKFKFFIFILIINTHRSFNWWYFNIFLWLIVYLIWQFIQWTEFTRCLLIKYFVGIFIRPISFFIISTFIFFTMLFRLINLSMFFMRCILLNIRWLIHFLELLRCANHNLILESQSILCQFWVKIFRLYLLRSV